MRKQATGVELDWSRVELQALTELLPLLPALPELPELPDLPELPELPELPQKVGPRPSCGLVCA